MTLLPVLHRQQHQQSDCLVACAAMVLDYLQVPVNYARLAKLLQTDPFGTVFRKIQNLEAFGLHILIEAGSVEKLRFHLENGLPCIVPVQTHPLSNEESTNHAVVVVGLEEDSIHINDPAFPTAPQIVTLAEFDLMWLEHDYFYAVIGLDEIL